MRGQGVTLFRDLLKAVFSRRSTRGNAGEDPASVYRAANRLGRAIRTRHRADQKIVTAEIAAPHRGCCSLGALSIMDGSIRGERFQPSEAEIREQFASGSVILCRYQRSRILRAFRFSHAVLANIFSASASTLASRGRGPRSHRRVNSSLGPIQSA